MSSEKKTSIRSMTAFGEGESFFSEGRFIVEIQSVNRRFLDIHPHIPRFLFTVEHKMREVLASQLIRGQVHIHVHFHANENTALKIKPNLALARNLKEAWEELCSDLKLSLEVSQELFFREKELFITEDIQQGSDAYHKALMEALEGALSMLVEERVREGKLLAEDLSKRLKAIGHQLSLIEEQSPEQITAYREKITKRLEEFTPDLPDNGERVIREVALMAEKLDVTEEIVRLKIHLKQFNEILDQDGTDRHEAVGKRLEFLIQELNREVNTIGSKSQTATIATCVVSMKSELEKIREQVNNIE